MKVNGYRVLEHCVELGTNYGWNRAHKHVDNPSEQAIKEEIINQIMNEITMWFSFDSEFTE